MNFEQAGLLDGLSGRERDAREKLLDRLAEDGFTLEELKAAVAEDRLALLPVERVLGARYTAREVEEQTGMPGRLMLRIRRLLGLPEAGLEDRVFGDEDVEAAKSAQLFLKAGLTEEALSEITRVMGESMRRFAATVAATFADVFLQAGDTEAELGERFATLTEELTPALSPVLVAAFNAHLRETVRRAMIGRAERESGRILGSEELAVCFADLVGFTRLGSEVEVQELGVVAGRLADLAGDAVEEPVRLIKTIGDAAMFVSAQPGPLVGVALRLVQAVEQAELPSLRAGIAFGSAQARGGDYYGHSVNLASRVTGIARPDSVLCTEEIRKQAENDYDWSYAGRHRLKGVEDRVPLFRARPLGRSSEHDGDAPKARGRKERRAKRT